MFIVKSGGTGGEILHLIPWFPKKITVELVLDNRDELTVATTQFRTILWLPIKPGIKSQLLTMTHWAQTHP